MKIISKVNELQEAVKAFREAGKSVGLVPTMGALHEGHKSAPAVKTTPLS